MLHSYFERKNNKILTFNIVHLPNFEMSASLELAPLITGITVVEIEIVEMNSYVESYIPKTQQL